MTVEVEEIKACLISSDPCAIIHVVKTSLNWLRILVISDRFESLDWDQREELVNQWLEPIEFSLSSYPIAGFELLTHAEAQATPSRLEKIRIPRWSDILMAPDPIKVFEPSDELRRPLIVTFYSFKGGVGRTTALGIVAGILATQNRRVVMIDLDLEAPGLSVLFPSPNPDQLGTLDYLHQRYLMPDSQSPSIQDCLFEVDLGKSRGELYLVPAGQYDENYIHRLADFNVAAFYQADTNPVEQLIKDINEWVQPDVILLEIGRASCRERVSTLV